jgi:hypothetical protein
VRDENDGKNGLDVDASRMMVAATGSIATRTGAGRSNVPPPPSARHGAHIAAVAPTVRRRRKLGHFLHHYGEMCAPMCIGFAVGDLVYSWAAGRLGNSDPFAELPELSVLVVTVTMTAPMAAWMLFRGMPKRAIAEMSAVMPVLAIVLLALGWLALLPKSDLALWEHGLMMPAMLVPMFFRLDLYTGRGGHRAHGH